jgi:hypothetical protein
MTINYKGSAILKINPNAKFSIQHTENEDIITWLDGTTPISKADIEAQLSIIEFEMSLDELRAKRNKLLADTDYLALSDNTMTEEVKTYRQALRDITEGLTTKEQVEAVVFPTKP